MAPPMARWMPPTNCRLSSHRVLRHGSSCLVAVLIIATPERFWPFTWRPVWMTISLLMSWVSSRRWTVRAPSTPRPPLRLLTKPVSTAPVAVLTAARPTRATPLTVVNRPPTYSVELVATTSEPRALRSAVKPVTVAPVVGLMEARPRLVTPLTELKVPVTNSLVLSGVKAMVSTPPPANFGLKPVSTRPVVRLYDARPWRA